MWVAHSETPVLLQFSADIHKQAAISAQARCKGLLHSAHYQYYVLPQFLMRLSGTDLEKFVSCACLQYSDYIRSLISPKQHLKYH